MQNYIPLRESFHCAQPSSRSRTRRSSFPRAGFSPSSPPPVIYGRACARLVNALRAPEGARSISQAARFYSPGDATELRRECGNRGFVYRDDCEGASGFARVYIWCPFALCTIEQCRGRVIFLIVRGENCGGLRAGCYVFFCFDVVGDFEGGRMGVIGCGMSEADGFRVFLLIGSVHEIW